MSLYDDIHRCSLLWECGELRLNGCSILLHHVLRNFQVGFQSLPGLLNELLPRLQCDVDVADHLQLVLVQLCLLWCNLQRCSVLSKRLRKLTTQHLYWWLAWNWWAVLLPHLLNDKGYILCSSLLGHFSPS